MPKLKCDVRSCVYNADYCCCKSMIKVIGEQADQSSETACASFHKKKRINSDDIYKVEFSKIDGINQYISIECESVNCIYNVKEICTAERVKIAGGPKASKYLETVCNSFEPKE